MHMIDQMISNKLNLGFPFFQIKPDAYDSQCQKSTENLAKSGAFQVNKTEVFSSELMQPLRANVG